MTNRLLSAVCLGLVLATLGSCAKAASFDGAMALFENREFKKALPLFAEARENFQKSNSPRRVMDCRVFTAWCRIELGELAAVTTLKSIELEAQTDKLLDNPLALLIDVAMARSLLIQGDYENMRLLMEKTDTLAAGYLKGLEESQGSSSKAADRAVKDAGTSLSRMAALWLSSLAGCGMHQDAYEKMELYIPFIRDKDAMKIAGSFSSWTEAGGGPPDKRRPIRDPDLFFGCLLFSRWEKNADLPALKADFDFAQRYFEGARLPFQAAFTRYFLARAIEDGISPLTLSGDVVASCENYDKALPVFELIRKDDYAATCLARSGMLKFQVGAYNDSRTRFVRALPIFTSLKNNKSAAEIVNYIASVDKSLGNLSLAENGFLKAAELFLALGDVRALAAANDNLGVIFSLQGEWEKALASYEKSITALDELLELETDAGKRLDLLGDRSAKLNNMAELLLSGSGKNKLADARRALADYINPGLLALESAGLTKTAIAGTLKLNAAKCRIIEFQNPGGAEPALVETAADLIAQAKTIFESLGLPTLLETARYQEGRLAYALGDTEKAERFFSAAADKFAESRDILSLARASDDLSITQEQNNKPAEALTALTNSVAAYDAYLRLIPSVEAQERYFAGYIGKYKLLIDKQLDSGAIEDAFLTAERMKARQLLQRLNAKQIDPLKRAPREFTDRLTEIDRYQTELANRYKEAYSRADRDNDGLKLIIDAISKAKAEREEILRDLRVVNSDIVDIEEAVVSGAEELQSVLQDGECLIEYAQTDRSLYAFILTNRSTDVAVLHSENNKDIRESDGGTSQKFVQTLVRDFMNAIRPAASGVEFDLAEIKSAKTKAAALYRVVFAPFAAKIASYKALVIVPSDILYTVPFQALYDPDRKAWLRDSLKQVVRYVPSASLFASIRKRTAKDYPEKFSSDYFGIGNPTYLDKTEFKPLAFAGEEIDFASRAFSGSPVALTGIQATEAEFKSRDLVSFRILHFACHGLTSGDGREFMDVPALALDPGPGEDGYLKYEEIAALVAKPELVVLSACKTGLGKFVEGDGIVGLHQAFLIAGARGVVPSLWSVDDQYTSEFMRSFFTEISNGLPGDLALITAMRETGKKLNAKGKPDHPYYWAPFVFYGDPPQGKKK